MSSTTKPAQQPSFTTFKGFAISSKAQLHLYNNLTKQKELFVPSDPGQVLIVNVILVMLVDIIRGILEHYFHYDVHYYLNVTDIDDKIIEQVQEKDSVEIHSGNNEDDLKRINHYEQELLNDMSSLHVQDPNFSAAISRSIPEVITFIEEMIEHGDAYLSNSSVYFGQEKSHQQHPCTKSEHHRMGDTGAFDEEQIQLEEQNVGQQKLNHDFVLWKKGEDEPVWMSPWGMGRPGLHIGCAIQACVNPNTKFDIHTGSMDSIFIRHDEELSQPAAHNNHHSWLYNFNNCYHLMISDSNISNSLENFGSMKQVIERFSSWQIRLLCLINSWSAQLDYSDHQMNHVLNYEKMLTKFIGDVRANLDFKKQLRQSIVYGKFEEELNLSFTYSKDKIHDALCDSIDTSTVMKEITELISTTMTYIERTSATNDILLLHVAHYVTFLLNTFGLNSGQGEDLGFTQ